MRLRKIYIFVECIYGHSPTRLLSLLQDIIQNLNTL